MAQQAQVGVDTKRNWSNEAEFCQSLIDKFHDTYGIHVRESGCDVWLSRIPEPAVSPEIQKILASIQAYQNRCYDEAENLTRATTTYDSTFDDDTDYPGGW